MKKETKKFAFGKHFAKNVETGIKARIFYSLDNRSDRKSCVTLYAKSYEDGHTLKTIFTDAYINNSDSMTDYFEEGRVVLFEDHPAYKDARSMAESLKK